ncbi:hypothetical protein ACIBEJ_34960 [Nonomuraea sp. NPDC050790]|uniref:hypothetical protein n=1 Tax=Nonomuraea sp. NPDC050790 TaxID=3364371 RepID=UPI003795C4EF
MSEPIRIRLFGTPTRALARGHDGTVLEGWLLPGTKNLEDAARLDVLFSGSPPLVEVVKLDDLDQL